jgi:phenylacetate-coenzyme A ligase PaaK-like adenylate-forming protein
MKKLLIGLFAVLSLTALASDLEDKVERDLYAKTPAITDGTISVPVHEYDVDLKKDKIKVEVELKGDKSKAEFEKMDKAKVEEYAASLAKYVQEELKSTLPVQVKIELDRDILPDEDLYFKRFQ